MSATRHTRMLHVGTAVGTAIDCCRCRRRCRRCCVVCVVVVVVVRRLVHTGQITDLHNHDLLQILQGI